MADPRLISALLEASAEHDADEPGSVIGDLQDYLLAAFHVMTATQRVLISRQLTLPSGRPTEYYEISPGQYSLTSFSESHFHSELSEQAFLQAAVAVAWIALDDLQTRAALTQASAMTALQLGFFKRFGEIKPLTATELSAIFYEHPDYSRGEWLRTAPGVTNDAAYFAWVESHLREDLETAGDREAPAAAETEGEPAEEDSFRL